jgi:NAD(P)-dependent dehydrogenase (short-subunit alcohol dehydrogenase family)
MSAESTFPFNLKGKIALVTGASRGVGKGVAQALAEGGATVYATGRTIQEMQSSTGKVIAVRCDHREDAQVRVIFDRIAQEHGRLDILANNVWGGYENMMENGEFTWTRPLPFTTKSARRARLYATSRREFARTYRSQPHPPLRRRLGHTPASALKNTFAKLLLASTLICA